MSAIRSSSSALLLLGGVATLPGAATVRSRFPPRGDSQTTVADAELGYMQQPLGPASSTASAAPGKNTPHGNTAPSTGPLWWQTQAL
ncbi:hypothetical protein CTA2_8579 [Colletotrichum tanaceti]|uniref:Uncharacterized protein n=1 Tax=Colletotrichum tanaceti TaxID=1306861 RepID=A0A4U6XQI0_9PEZI|nr:hypothetical protein CTA2_8579 [Colletotrichum tanaceti]TKW58090.1 hypothetical protein CTA1_11085 [Colletotrichum tanaceti]